MYVQATDSSWVNLQWSVHPWNRFHGWTFHQPLKKKREFFQWVEKILLSSWPTNETVFWKDKFWCVHKRSCIITNDVSLEMKFSGHWKTFEGWNWRTCFFFRYNESFLLKNISFTLATEFVHRTKNKIVFTTQCCFEKRTWKWQWKTTKSFTAKSSRILEDFLDPSLGKRRNFESCIFFLVWWNEIGRNTFPIDRH